MKSIYLIGSLRNPEVPRIATEIRHHGYEVFDDWFSAGPEADDCWQRYEEARSRPYQKALKAYPAEQVWNYDKTHLNRCDVGLLLMPAGKSGHLELGYMVGLGKKGIILLPKVPDRWDVMYRFAEVCISVPEVLKVLQS